MAKQGTVTVKEVVAAEDRVRTKLEAEAATVAVQLADAKQVLAGLDKEYTAAVKAADKAWGDPAKDPTGKKLEAWVAANRALERVIGRRFGAFDMVERATQQLAKLQDPATYDERLVATQVNRERFAQLRESVGPRVRTPKAPKLEPPGHEELTAAMEAAKPGYQEYVAAQEARKAATAAGDVAAGAKAQATMDKLRGTYQAYRKAYNGLLKLRKEHREAVEAMANGAGS